MGKTKSNHWIQESGARLEERARLLYEPLESAFGEYTKDSYYLLVETLNYQILDELVKKLQALHGVELVEAQGRLANIIKDAESKQTVYDQKDMARDLLEKVSHLLEERMAAKDGSNPSPRSIDEIDDDLEAAKKAYNDFRHSKGLTEVFPDLPDDGSREPKRTKLSP